MFGYRQFAILNPQSAIRNPQFLALIILLSSALLAQTTGLSYTIYGRVTLPDGSAASRVTIIVSGQSGFSRQVFTDDAGQYEIQGVPRGRYSLAAANPAAPEQYSDRAEIELTRLSPNRVSLNLYLRTGTKVESAKENKSSGVSVAEAAQHIPKAAQKEYEKAIKQGKKQQLEKAMQSFNRSIELFPEYFQAISERGHLHVAMGQIEEAEKDFARALELNARYEPAMRGTGICKLREGKFLDAIKDLEHAVSIEPRDSAAYLFLGFANASLDRREDARAALQKALILDAIASARAHVHLANLDLKENRNREAAAELEAYLATVPNPPDADKLRTLLAQLKTQTQKPQ
jgi:tetratricopeptide (TPR) repeat protein